MKTLWTRVAVAAIAGLGLAVAAQAAAPQQSQSTPKTWNWKYDKAGNRIAKGDRVTKADGSWREEIPQGNGCVLVKEKSANGDYRQYSECKPQ